MVLNKILPDIIWRMSDENVYLTFDDGPDKEITPQLLHLLKQFDIQATFFVVGQKVEQYPEIITQIQSHGHTLGNHSFSHSKMLWNRREIIKFEFKKTDEVLTKITGVKPNLFRPPHGSLGWSLLREVKSTNHKIVLWSKSPRDYKLSASATDIQTKLENCCQPGQIVLLHDGHKNSANSLMALEAFLGKFMERNMKFSALPNSLNFRTD